MRVFLVRHLIDRQAVGLFWTQHIEGLIELADDVIDPDACEYFELKGLGGLSWCDHAPPLGVEGEHDTDGIDARMQELWGGVGYVGSMETLWGTIEDNRWKPLVPASPRLDDFRAKAKRFRAGLPIDVTDPEPADTRRPRVELPDPVNTVYFFGCGDYIKIGVTSGPVERRLKSIATSHHQEIVILATIQNAPSDLEFNLHQRFAGHRVRGEWFAAAPEILAFIEEVKAGT